MEDDDFGMDDADFDIYREIVCMLSHLPRSLG